MLTTERKQLILQTLRRDGRIVAKTFSQQLDVSEDTIRRDLRDLASEGLLQRVHGGALPSSPAVGDTIARRAISVEGKTLIAQAAAHMVRSGQVVMLDGGTTSIQIARHLPRDLKATFVTHSPEVAVELAKHPSIDIELIGGRLFRHSMVSCGVTTAQSIARINADLYFMGVTGIHERLGFTTGDSEEAAIKQALSRQAGETIVMASQEKLGAASPFLIANLDEVDAMIVEPDTPEDTLSPFRKASLTVIIPTSQPVGKGQ